MRGEPGRDGPAAKAHRLISGPILGQPQARNEAAERLAAYAKALGPQYRLRMEASLAHVRLIVEKLDGKVWKKTRQSEGPTAIDAIRGLTGPAPKPAKA